MRLLRRSSVMDQRDARTTTEEDHYPSVGSTSAYRGPNRAAGASPPPLLDLRQQRLAATARTAISGPSTKISARFLCCNVGSTNAVTCRNAQALLPHKNQEARWSRRGRSERGVDRGPVFSLLG